MGNIFDKAINKIKFLRLRKKGFSQMGASAITGAWDSEGKSGAYEAKTIAFGRKHGFFPSTVKALGINEENYRDYLSDVDYMKLAPLDGLYHSWIDNKLLLKYLLGDLAGYMPKYYFQLTPDREVLRLMDCPKEYAASWQGVLDFTKANGTFCLKAIKGYGGAGFYKVDRIGDCYLVNDENYTEERFLALLKELKNFILMEYLSSDGIASEIYPKTANSIRVMIGVEGGKKYQLGSFIKFGDKDSGYVDNLSGGGISCPIDEHGHFHKGYTLADGVMVEVHAHPDTGAALSGQIEEWPEIMKLADAIMERLPQLTYLGFDFVISTEGIKILEINDKSGLLTIQKNTPLLKDREDNFYLKRLAKLQF